MPAGGPIPPMQPQVPQDFIPGTFQPHGYYYPGVTANYMPYNYSFPMDPNFQLAYQPPNATHVSYFLLFLEYIHRQPRTYLLLAFQFPVNLVEQEAAVAHSMGIAFGGYRQQSEVCSRISSIFTYNTNACLYYMKCDAPY